MSGDLIVAGGARRAEIRRRHGNGLDTVEVDEGGHRLVLTFLEHAPDHVHPSNVLIVGPPGAPPLTVTRVRRATEDDPRLEDRLLVELAHPGGRGSYQLRLVEPYAAARPGRLPFRGLDGRLAEATFSFDLDLAHPAGGASGPAPGPSDQPASYLARDYQGLRQLILDRLAETMPTWTERHVPDIGITLVELLAYIGDDLSYYQDSVATEAYLQTARQRISVRRHARLVDYQLGEGCQARAWICLAVRDPAELPLNELVFIAAPNLVEGGSPRLSPQVLESGTAMAFTPVRATFSGTSAPAAGHGPTLSVDPAHNQMAIWAWGEHDSRLRSGATSATLVDHWTDPDDRGSSAPRALRLCLGDVVVFEATVDPSGIGPADPTLRHAVRLSGVVPNVDRLYDQPVVEISWADADALPFDLQVTGPAPDGGVVTCAVVRGNTALAGHGHRGTEQLTAGTTTLTHPNLSWASPHPGPGAVARHQAKALDGLPEAWRRQVEEWRRQAEAGEPLGEARLERLRRLLGEDVLTSLGWRRGQGPDHDAERLRHLLLDADRVLAPRVRRLGVLAALARASGPLDAVLLREIADDWGPDLAAAVNAHDPASWGPAAAAAKVELRRALPLLGLAPVDGGRPWTVVRDVVDSGPGSRQVMVEVDDAGFAHLRFSDGDEPDGPVEASYQTGQGAAGNVPAEAINAVVALTPGAASVIQSLGNPLPAAGGTDPETIVAAKAALPGAFRADPRRALVAADYSAAAEAVPGVRRAATVLRWTGTRRGAYVAVQPLAGEDPSRQLLTDVTNALWPLRRIGHELWVRPPAYRPLRVGLDVAIGPDAIRAEVAADLRALLGSGWQVGGVPGLFNPVRVAFGQSVYASAIVAAVQDIAGVEAVVLTQFGFLDEAARRPSERLRLGPSEIARLDNDPAAPERGYATINLQGGR